MRGPFFSGAVRHVGTGKPAGKNGGADLCNQCKTVTLMATVLLADAAKRKDPAEIALTDAAPHFVRISFFLTCGIYGPLSRKRLACFFVDFHLSQRYNGRGCVKPEREWVRGHGKCNRIGAEHRTRAEGWDADLLCIRHGNADHPFRKSQSRIVTGDAKVTGIADSDHADTALFCLFDGQAHCIITGDMAQTLMRVERGTQLCLL